MFVNKSAENGRTVIPLRFHGENSKFFYNFAKIRAKSGLKFNIEMLCLPRELFLARGKQFRISILDPIGPELLTPGSAYDPSGTFARAQACGKHKYGIVGCECGVDEEQINEVLTATAGLRDAEFCDATLKCLGVSYTAEGLDRLPPPQHKYGIVGCECGVDGRSCHAALGAVFVDRHKRAVQRFA